jgi:folate-binding protein YgfZ
MTTKDELTAIRESAGIFPLDDRAFLRITGEDATRWLNGMVTNSIQSLAPGEGNYNFLLNAQGRIQGDCTIYREPGQGDATYLLESDKSQIETIQHHLDKFIIMDDVELSPAMTEKLGLLVVGAGALGTLDVGFIWPPTPISMSYSKVANDGVEGDEIVLSIAPNRYELWGDQSHIAWMSSLGERQVTPEAIEALRILEGRPKFGKDIRERDLPQETNQTHALHFTKGCYLGQEIVERIHSRGQVHRTFTGFRLTALPPTLPAPLTSEGKPAGEITSAAIVPLPEGDTVLALGYARREALDRNTPLTYEGGTATPATLPFTPS